MGKAKAKESSNKPPEQVKRDGAYVMMLFITMLAIAGGCLLLYFDYEDYAGKAAPKEAAPSAMKLGEALKADPIAPPAPPGGGGGVPPGGGGMPPMPPMP